MNDTGAGVRGSGQHGGQGLGNWSQGSPSGPPAPTLGAPSDKTATRFGQSSRRLEIGGWTLDEGKQKPAESRKERQKGKETPKLKKDTTNRTTDKKAAYRDSGDFLFFPAPPPTPNPKLEVELSGPVAEAAAPRRLAPSALLSSDPRAAAGDADTERSSGFFFRRRFGRAAVAVSIEFLRPVTKSRSDEVREVSLLRRLRPLQGQGESCGCCWEGAGEGLVLMLLRPLVVVLAAAMVFVLGGRAWVWAGLG